MTVREKAALQLLAVGSAALTAAAATAGVVLAGLAGGVVGGCALLGLLALAGGLMLGLGDDSDAGQSWLTVLDEWATAAEPGPLDFDGIPVPERMVGLLDQALRAA